MTVDQMRDRVRVHSLLDAGRLLQARSKPRRVPVPVIPVAPVCLAGAADVQEFLGMHGQVIAGLLQRCEGERQKFALVKGYRSIVRGKPDARAAWALLIDDLGL